MPNIGLTEILVVVAVIALLFGAKRIPEAARGLGRAFKSFKKGLDEGDQGPKESEKDK